MRLGLRSPSYRVLAPSDLSLSEVNEALDVNNRSRKRAERQRHSTVLGRKLRNVAHIFLSSRILTYTHTQREMDESPTTLTKCHTELNYPGLLLFDKSWNAPHLQNFTAQIYCTPLKGIHIQPLCVCVCVFEYHPDSSFGPCPSCSLLLLQMSIHLWNLMNKKS